MTFYSQKTYKDKLGTCNVTIAEDGCFLVSFCNLNKIIQNVDINPSEFNKIAFPNGGCLANASYWASLYNLDYLKTTQIPKNICIAETNHYQKLGFPQHFFLYDPLKKLRVDPLDLNPQWEPNDYNIISYRVFTKKQPQLIGCDVSHYQKEVPKKDFVICKCTEGLTYIDPTYQEKKKFCRDNNIPFGAYHFADGADPKQEAFNFLAHTGDLIEGDLLALDSETGQSPEWCQEWLDFVTKQVGFKPLLYSPVGGWKVKLDYPLWVARYGHNNGQINSDQPPNIGKWDKWTIWQYSSANNLDLDLFSGTVDDLKSLGKPKQKVPPPIEPQIDGPGYSKDDNGNITVNDGQPILRPDEAVITPDPFTQTENKSIWERLLSLLINIFK